MSACIVLKRLLLPFPQAWSALGFLFGSLHFYRSSVLTFLHPLLSLYFVNILFLEKYIFACFPAYFNQSIFHSNDIVINVKLLMANKHQWLPRVHLLKMSLWSLLVERQKGFMMAVHIYHMHKNLHLISVWEWGPVLPILYNNLKIMWERGLRFLPP